MTFEMEDCNYKTRLSLTIAVFPRSHEILDMEMKEVGLRCPEPVFSYV